LKHTFNFSDQNESSVSIYKRLRKCGVMVKELETKQATLHSLLGPQEDMPGLERCNLHFILSPSPHVSDAGVHVTVQYTKRKRTQLQGLLGPGRG
jgi:hypothetical protein